MTKNVRGSLLVYKIIILECGSSSLLTSADNIEPQ